MRIVSGDKWGINVAIGWPARWLAEIEPEGPGIRLRAGQRRCHMKIRPGETIRTPRVTFLAYSGDESRGMNEWRRWYITHILPKENGRPFPPKLCLHVFEAEGMPEFTGANEQNQMRGLDSYIEKNLTPDIWWIDAGWYPCKGEWHKTGTWKIDSERFPRGLLPIGEKCAEHNTRFLLWFEPERVFENSDIAKKHPEWLLKCDEPDEWYKKNALLNLAIPECVDFITDTVDAIIKENHVTIYRQDFNFDPAPCWDEAETEDRIGAVENLHVQGYLRYWDELLRRNPGLVIDSCSSGGRRNDLETMRRAVTLHYTDIGYGNHPRKQKQHRLMFEWIPYFRAHNMNCLDPETCEYGSNWFAPDSFAYYSAFVPAITDMTPHNAGEKDLDLAHKMIGIWKQVAPFMLSGDYYPLTVCRKSSEDFYAMQFHDEISERGFFQILSNARNPERHFILRLHAVDPSSSYLVTDLYTGKTLLFKGKQLIDGVEYELDAKSAIVCVYQVVYLYYFEDYPADKIGKILNKNVNTVYTLLARARTLLKEKLEGEENAK